MRVLRMITLILAGLSAAALPAAAQQVDARLDRSRIGVGETTILRVVVRGAGNAREPALTLPEGLQSLGMGRQQSFSWVNGRASSETEFRIEILAEAVGTFPIGPIDVAVGGKTFRGSPVTLVVTEAPPEVSGSSGGGPAPATLSVDVEPRSPYVGQAMTLRVRLVQRAAFAEDPQYLPPTTTGFWTDRFTAPESYYAELRGERVLVTETRARLFPLAVGEATIGEAAANIVIASGGIDPFLSPGDRRNMRVRSQPVRVRVRPLPGGAPRGFTGGVGSFDVRWSADRPRTSRDVPVTVRLDVRGRGNLPLLRPPDYTPQGFEVFASSVEDSASAEGAGAGRKRFQWTLLPRRGGSQSIPPPSFAWFDPAAGRYRSASLAPLPLDVGPPVFAGSGPEAGFPRAIAGRPIRPGSREPVPWAYALAGLALGLAVRWWPRRAAESESDRQIRQWTGEVRGARGPDFWQRAEHVMRGLEGLGKVPDDPPWRDARAAVAAARYGGGAGDTENVRRVLLEHLERARPAQRSGAARGALALVLAALGVALALLMGPKTGEDRYARLAAEADQWARRGELSRARTAWQALWREGGQNSGLAARLAWLGAQGGDVGSAALWVLRGELAGARDPALGWVAERVREAGGLMGSGMTRLPVRDLEWSIVGLLAAAAATWRWRRRRWSLALGAVALIAGITSPLERAWVQASGRAVVLRATRLDGTDVELDPGQVVRVRGNENGRVRVQIGSMTEGWLPATTVGRIEDAGGSG